MFEGFDSNQCVIDEVTKEIINFIKTEKIITQN